MNNFKIKKVQTYLCQPWTQNITKTKNWNYVRVNTDTHLRTEWKGGVVILDRNRWWGGACLLKFPIWSIIYTVCGILSLRKKILSLRIKSRFDIIQALNASNRCWKVSAWLIFINYKCTNYLLINYFCKKICNYNNIHSR